MNLSPLPFADHGKKLIECLFGNFFRENTGYIEYRAIAKAKDTSFPPVVIFCNSVQEATSDETVQKLTNLNNQGFNIYVGVCPRFRQSGREEDASHITALWADLDFKDFVGGGAEAWELVNNFPLKPSLINKTGHGLHLYWLLEEAQTIADANKIKSLLKGLGKFLNGDSVFDLPRVLRVPGFVNYKPDKDPVYSELMEECFCPDLQYTLFDFEPYWVDAETEENIADLQEVPKEVLPRFEILLRNNKHFSDTWFGRRNMPNKNTRSEYDLSVADQLVDHGFTDNEIAAILLRCPSGKGEDATLPYLARTIGKARVKPAKGKQEDAPDFKDLLATVPEDTDKGNLPEALEPFFRALAYQNEATIISVLYFNVKQRFGLTNEVLKCYEKTVRQYKKQIPLKPAETTPAELFSEQELQMSRDLLLRPTLLHEVLQLLGQLGLAGEEQNALIQYLSFTSRLLEQPVSVTVKGDSSAGKSFTLGMVMKLIPKSAYIEITDATPQSFFYVPEGQFKHKIVVIFEMHGMEKANYSIRNLQSEGKIAIQVTVKNPETGAFEGKNIEHEGPTGFITTTTSSLIHGENETRVLSVFPDQSKLQTKRIYEATNEKYLGKRKTNDGLMRTYRALQTQLTSYPILIPYVKSISDRFPCEIMRTRRDYKRFLALIEASTLFHQEQRFKTEIDGQIYLKASLADYEIARILSDESLLKSIFELPSKTIELIKEAREMVQNHESDKDGLLTVSAMAKRLGWDRDTVAKWLKPAEKKMFFTRVEEALGNKGVRYRVEREIDLPSESFLPSVDVIARENPEEPTDGIYNPITGTAINVESGDTTEA